MSKNIVYFEGYEVIDSDINDVYIQLVKNKTNGLICIQKIIPIELTDIYSHLQKKHIKNTPKIYDIKVDKLKSFVLCEYIDGMTLTDYINAIYLNEKSFDKKLFYKQINTLCDIINELQKSKFIIHRDIKPDNIMIDKNDELFLIDFDSAKIYNPLDTEDTTKLGTERYAAPEQYGFGASNKSTDMYAIGKIISDYCSVADDKKVEERLEKVIDKCCQVDYRDRYKNLNLLKADLFRSEYGFMNFALPGFRSSNFIHMLIATVVYITLFYSTIINTRLGNSKLGIVLFIAIMLFILIFYNYLDVDRIIPFAKSKNVFVKYLSKCFFSLIIPFLIILAYIHL